MIQVTSGIRDRILKSIKHLDQFETGQGNIYGNDNIEILQNLIDISRYTDYYKYNAIRNNTSIIGNKYINISSTLFKNRFLSMRDYKNIWFYYHDF